MKKLFFISFISIVSLNGGLLDSVSEFIPMEKKQVKSDKNTQSNELLDSIKSATNLNSSQTIGTVGTLLSYAKNNMDNTEYSNIVKKVPALNSFSNTNGLTSLIGDTLSSNEMVNNSLKTLGVEPEIVKIVIPIIVGYVGKYAGDIAKNTMQNSLSGLLK